MSNKIFGKTYLLILSWLFFLATLSFLLYWYSSLNFVIFVLLCFCVFVLSLYKLEYGLIIVLIELFTGSKGYLFSLNLGEFSLSIRIGLFIAVMLVFVLKSIYWLIKNKEKFKLKVWLKENLGFAWKKYLWLWLFLLLGLVFALLEKNKLTNIFFDFNAWLYLLYLPLFIYGFKKNFLKNNFLQIFSACLTFIALKSLVLLFIFSHNLSWVRSIYKWGRDIGWGEFTLIQDNFFRIFSQSQIYILIGFFVFLSLFFNRKKLCKKENYFLLSSILLMITVIVLSLSRTFWLAGLLTFVVFIIYSFKFYKVKLMRLLKLLGLLSALTIISLSLILLIVNFPYPSVKNTSDLSLIKNRLESNEAVSSRWSQLKPLSLKILNEPLLGSGWGATVEYQSTDPRILTLENPEGWYETFAFEWGYLDFLLKFGLVGTLIYLSLIYNICKKGLDLLKKNKDNYFVFGLILGLISLVLTHVFSPYLNHPLGIGYLLILIAIFNSNKKSE